MRLFRLLAIIMLGFAAVPAGGQAWAFEASHAYVQPQQLPPQLLVPPPAEKSKAWSKQIDAVIGAQRNLSAAELAAMKDEQRPRLDAMTAALGPNFTREKLPKTFAMLDRVMSDSVQIIEADKKFWHTRRPYLTDARVKLHVDAIDESPAYPSGHTAVSRVLAEVLGLMAPEKLTELRDHADSIARHRVEAGVHYPVDLEGGRMAAMMIVGALMANEDFHDDLEVARKEIAGR